MFQRVLATIAFFTVAVIAPAQDAALIVRLSRMRGEPNESATSIAHFLAAEFDQDGRIAPIVWSLADPVFRAAAESGTIRETVREPAPEDIKDAAQKLKAAYIFVIVEEKKEGALYATLEVFKTGSANPIYKNTRNLVVTVGNRLDWENAARSHAHYWYTTLIEGPFKKLKPRPRPEEDNTPTIVPAAEVFPTDPKALDTAKTKIQGGDFAGALTVLRDAVDADPTLLEKRMALIQLLTQLRMQEQVASEARRAAVLFPEQAELRLIAVRAWLALDKTEEASVDLNEFLARKSDDASALALLGDLWISRQEPEKAIEPFTKSIEISSSFSARFGRALAHALTGNSAGCTADLAALGTPSPKEIETSYPVAVRSLEGATEHLGAKLREVLQKTRIQSNDPAVVKQAEDALALAQSLASMTDKISVPPKHQQSHLRRDLAQKLLVQAAGEALAFAKSGDEDLGSDAAISLGDALNQMHAIRKQYEAELGT